MKLGTQTGSLTNHLMANVAKGDVKVGDGATVCMWTDRHAATVIKITPCSITVQHDTATRIDKNGMSDSQEYTYQPNPAGQIQVFRRNKHGRWRAKSGDFLSLGQRNEYHDFSF